MGRRLNSLTKQKFYESFLNYINPYFPSLVASLSPTLNTFNYKEIWGAPRSSTSQIQLTIIMLSLSDNAHDLCPICDFISWGPIYSFVYSLGSFIQQIPMEQLPECQVLGGTLHLLPGLSHCCPGRNTAAEELVRTSAQQLRCINRPPMFLVPVGSPNDKINHIYWVWVSHSWVDYLLGSTWNSCIDRFAFRLWNTK